MSVIVIMFAIIFLLNLPPIINQILTSLSFFFAIIVTISVIFVSKIIYLFQGKDMNGKLSMNDNIKNKRKNKSQTRIHNIQFQRQMEITQTISKDDLNTMKKVLNGLNNSKKLQLCLQNINIWNDLLMKIGDSSDGNDNDNERENEDGNDFGANVHRAQDLIIASFVLNENDNENDFERENDNNNNNHYNINDKSNAIYHENL